MPDARSAGRKFLTRGPAYTLFLLMVIYTSNFVDRMIVGVVAEPIKQDLGLADWQIGLVGGLAFALFYTGLGIPLARLADRYRRATIIGWCLVIWSAMTMLCGAVQGFGQLLLARIGVGIGEAGCTPAAQSLICDVFPPAKRPFALSVFTLGVPLGLLIGAAGGGWIAQHLGWRFAFLIVGFPGVLLALVTWATIPEPVRGGFDEDVDVEAKPPPFAAVVRTMVSSPALLHILAGSALGSMANYSSQTFAVPFLLRGFGLSLVEASSGFGLATGISLVTGMLVGGWLAQRLGARDNRFLVLVPAIGVIAATPLTIATYLQHSLPWVGVFFVLSTIGQGFIPGPMYAAVNSLVSMRMRATAIAILLLVMNLVGMGLGPLLVGTVSDIAAAHVYGPDFARACGRGAAGGPACLHASFAGLRIALVFSTVTLVWAAVHFLLAARAMGRSRNISRSSIEPAGWRNKQGRFQHGAGI
jgi:predicted MFS family arabinose efflux permease